MRGGDLHLHVDRLGAHVERAAEDIGKSKDVVDLVGIVRPPGGDDGVGTNLIDRLGRDLRVGIGHGEDDRLWRHRPHHVLAHHVLGGKTKENIRAAHGVGERAGVGVDGVSRLPLIHVALAPAPDHPSIVDGYTVFGPNAHRLDQFQRSDAGRPRPAQDEFDILEPAPGDGAGVDKARGRNDCRPVLVVMKHRDVEKLLQLGLDAKTLRALDVLKIYAAERIADVLDYRDDFIRIPGENFDVYRVDIGEPFEEHALALHHWLGRQGP